MSTGKALKKIGKGFLYFLLIVLVLVCAFIFFINIPYGKRVVKNRVQSYLSAKLKTKVEIGAVDYSLPKWIEIRNVYIEDQYRDTLIYGEEISADISMFKLLRGNTDIGKLFFRNILINVSRKETDSVFNFQFVIDAFTGNKPAANVDPDTAALKLSLDRLIFDNVAMRFKDGYGGTDFATRIKYLDATMERFQPDRLLFAIKEFRASGVDFFMSIFREPPPVIKEVAARRDTLSLPTPKLLLTAGLLDLRDVNVTIDNRVNGMFYSNEVTHLNLVNTYFDAIQTRAYADRLELDSSDVAFRLPVKATQSAIDTADRDEWIIKVPEIKLTKNSFRFDDPNIARAAGLDFSHLNAKEIYMDGSFNMGADTTRAVLKHFAFRDTSGFQLDSLFADVLFADSAIVASGVYMKTPVTEFRNETIVLYNGLDALTTNPDQSYVNAKIINSTIAMNDLYLLLPTLRTSFPPEKFAGQKIFVNTELRGTLAQVYLPFFRISGLSGSVINGKGYLTNLHDPQKLGYNIDIANSTITREDLLKFVDVQSAGNIPAVFNLSGGIKGNTRELVADIRAAGGDVRFSGVVALSGLDDPGGVKYAINAREVSMTRDVIMAFMPAGSLPPNVKLPPSITASGQFRGTATGFESDLNLVTTYGNATLKGYMRNMNDPGRAVYDMYITLRDFDLGTLLTDTLLGITTLSAYAKGTGLDYKTMQSNINADIAYIGLNDYNYHNANIESRFNAGDIYAQGNVADSNLVVDFSGNINVRTEYPAFDLVMDIDTARLQPLNFFDSQLDISGYADLNAQSLQPGSLDARFFLDSFTVRNDQGPYYVDTISLIATSQDGVDDIRLRSPFAYVDMNGRFQYDKLHRSIGAYVDSYYDIGSFTPPVQDQQVDFNAEVFYHPLVTVLIPGLHDYDSVTLNGRYVSGYGDSALVFNASAPYVAYDKYVVRNTTADINSANGGLGFNIVFDTLHTPGRIFYGSTLNGRASNDSLQVAALTQDKNAQDWFALDASLYTNNNEYTFRLNDRLLLNYEPWTVNEGNYIVYSPQGLLVNDFVMRSDTASISLNSREPVMNSPVDMVIDNFNLKSVSSFLNNDTILLAGILDAQMAVTDWNKQIPGFSGNATVKDLTVMNGLLGDLTLNAAKTGDNEMAADLQLSGNGNDIYSEGRYYLNNAENQFDAYLDVRRFNVASIQPVIGNMISDARGNISGTLTMGGKLSNPDWQGSLEFDSTKFVVTEFGTPYYIDGEEIVLDHPDILFNDFQVEDSLGHELTIDGAIIANTLTNYDLDLYLNTADFIVIDAPKAIGNEIYGFASVDANLTITGNSEVPEIEGDIFVNDNSDITLVIPERAVNKDAARTVVRFIDQDTFNLNEPVLFEPERDPGMTFGRFLNYNLNIEITRNSAVTIVVDPVTGDELRVKGDAQLNTGVDPGGNLIIAGNYELEEGHYILNYQFLQRRFTLTKGSTIFFVGDPMDAIVDIRAEYIANTSSRELLANEVSTVSSSLANSFNQRIPFRVMLHLTGVLSKPDIDFDIQLPDEDAPINSELRTTVENKLIQIRGDESATNKQVFSLLLFNRFVGEQSSDFFKGNSSDFNDLARQSVSQFLSAALDEIASDLFKGIDVDLNLNTYRDFSNGGNSQRTDLNIALSKSFLDDRLVVSVGTNIGIEGQDPAAKAGSNYSFMPDVTLAYKLTKDGRYMIRAYRRNQFEVVLDGYVVENGVGFVVTMNYEKFRELFHRPAK